MVKRREPAHTLKNTQKPTDEQIEAFAAKADGGTLKNNVYTHLNPSAKRDFKGIRVPLNEYEYKKLTELSEKTGRTKLNVIRFAILKLANEL
ncbi:hypothetical protein C2855_21670 [Aeromonas bestiarum]|jgi:hypothetical protein|uniref:hypothetical protein n=1 Tax=Aeromonas bestiarum TaxID=105751 RepID=UPI000CD44269|nr:hypothetical protein [Aeromonas bestiarum]POG21175.1 hypothetical protein C2855_21670 [Aeromonas bestiarum]